MCGSVCEVTDLSGNLSSRGLVCELLDQSLELLGVRSTQHVVVAAHLLSENRTISLCIHSLDDV